MTMDAQIKSAFKRLLIVILIICNFHKTYQTVYVYNENHNGITNYSELVQSITPEVHSVEDCALTCHMTNCRAFTYDVRTSLCNFHSPAGLRYATQSYVRLFPLCNGLSVGGPSKVYTIQSDSYNGTVEVLCDMDTDGGGWTVIQNRFDGSQNFYNTWEEYKTGFGDLGGEFWIGNEIIHSLTTEEQYELYIDMTDMTGDFRYARYDSFSVSSEQDEYRMTVSGFHGTVAFDSFVHANNSKFSTKDKDNDEYTGSCANWFHGGWWYISCFAVNLNGLYSPSSVDDLDTMCWSKYKSTAMSYTSLARSKMMIRPYSG